MKVAFRLRRLTAAEPAAALLLPGHDVPAVLHLCARLGAMPRVHLVAGGFLLLLPETVAGPLPGTVRLRRLAENLLVPADAALVPPLRDDEAAGLVRRRGLVFLPGGRVLAFDPGRPLPLSSLLTAGGVRRPACQLLPARPALPERIREILLDPTADLAEAILDPGGESIGTEEPRPEEAGPGANLLGQAQFAAGRTLLGLGQALGLTGLARLGAQWMQGAVSWVPRLSESVLGRQEAALRALLREFREGSLERALRRALPLGEAGARGGVPAAGARLPLHNLRYALGELLGGGGGRAGLWFGGYDVQAELAREYHKAAEQAVRAGDYRRAAFIYGKLLRDYRLAATALVRGGLHHDAAILYLKKVGDTLAAARAFEAAGEVDQALRLYRQCGEHLAAGDLLRRTADEDAAAVEYRAAADKLLHSPQGYLAAGELLRTRAGRADLAREYFAGGWALRPEPNALACALHLAELYAGQESPADLLALLAEAEEFLRPPGNDAAAGRFYNAVARLADREPLAAVRGELRDRALLGIATKLRQNAALPPPAGGNLTSALLGQAGAWAAAVVSDAHFAVQAGLKRPCPTAAPAPGVPTVHLGQGTVTAACFAPLNGEVFLGFATGEVACYQPLSDRVARVAGERPCPVTSLAVDKGGNALAVLLGDPAEPQHFLYTYWRDSLTRRHQARQRLVAYGPGPCWLVPQIVHAGDHVLGIWREGGLALRGLLLLPKANAWEMPDGPEPATALLLPCLPGGPDGPPPYFVYLIAGDAIYSLPPPGQEPARAWLGWTPAPTPGDACHTPSLSWLQRSAEEELVLAGLNRDGNVCWSVLRLDEARRPETIATHRTRGARYRAAALVRPGLVAAVGPHRIDWLRCGSGGFDHWSATPVDLPAAVACFASDASRELLVVCQDGTVARVPMPG